MIIFSVGKNNFIDHHSIGIPKTSRSSVSVGGEGSYEFCYTKWKQNTILMTHLGSMYFYSLIDVQLKPHLLRIHIR